MNKQKTSLMLSILGILSIVLITAGATYAFFSFGQQGTTDNIIKTGSITFLYTETSGVGKGIAIENAFPVSDEVGKVATGEGEYFDFKVTSDTGNQKIGYEVTARKSTDSANIDENIRVYLTKVNGLTEEQVLLDNYDNLPQTSKVESARYTEKTIYTGEVPANQTGYEQAFRLRMWLDKDTDFSDGTMNSKTFTLTVNVYANAEVVTTPATYASYNIGDEVTLIDGSKWHVLEASDETNASVVLLSDDNLNSDGTYALTCMMEDYGGDFICEPMAFDTDGTNVYDETDSNNIGYFIKNTYAPLVISALPGTTNVTLPTAYQIATADNQAFNQTQLTLTTEWLYTRVYWTSTSSNDQYGVWYVSSDGTIDVTLPPEAGSVAVGVRPVITTLKSNILNTMTSDTVLSIGDSVTGIDGSKWHVLKASGSDSKYVTLLSDYNLNSDGSYNTTCGRDINGDGHCSTMAFDSDNVSDYNVNDSNNIGYFVFNTYKPLVTSALPRTEFVYLPTAEEIAAADGQTFDQSNGVYLTSSWLLTTNYWTSTSGSDTDVWVVGVLDDINMGFTNANDAGYSGVRPAIRTLKSNLLAR